MKHILKLTTCITLAAILLLSAACGGNTDSGNDTNNTNATTNTTTPPRATATATTTGRFVETDITPPIDGWFTALITPGGTLAAFDKGLRNRYDSADGGDTWTHSPGPGSGTSAFEDVRAAGFMPDGSLLVYLPGSGMTIIATNGDTSHLPIGTIDQAVADGDSHIMSLIQIQDDGQLLLSYSIDWIARMMADGDFGDLAISRFGDAPTDDTRPYQIDGQDIDPEATDSATDDTDDAPNMTIGGRQVAGGTAVREGVQVGAGARVAAGSGGFSSIGGFGSHTTALYNIETGEQTASLSHLETLPMQGLSVVGANSRGDAFVLDGYTILRYGANGDVDFLLDGAAFTVSAATSHVTTIQNIGDSLFVTANTMEGQRLFKYHWDENATIDPDKTITIWSLYDNAMVRAAMTDIWRRHPDAYITYEVALSGDTAITAADAVRTLNTRLLSGSGPDIIILDGVPIDSYAGRGMLLDLTGRVDTSDVYQNLLAPYMRNGNTYVIPTQFSIPVLMGSPGKLAPLTTLNALVESIVGGNPPVSMEDRFAAFGGGINEEDRAQTAFNDLNELFDLMWHANASAFIHDNRLNSDALREFLAAIAAISDMYGLATADDMMSMGVMSVVVSSAPSGGAMRPGRANILTGSLMNYMTHSTNIAAFAVNNIMFLQGATTREDSEFIMFPGLVEGAWLPSTLVGVSADTAVADFAVEFVNTMLSFDVQLVNHGEGLPVTRRGVQGQIDMLNETLMEFTDTSFDIDMDGLIAQLVTPTIIEDTLRAMVWETVERLADGNLDLEGAVQAVEQGTRNYLAERQ